MRNLFSFFSFFIFLFLVSFIFAQAGGIDNIRLAISGLCTQVKSLIPVIVFLMVVAGGVVYAAGQVFGAEVRSRANVWATAMIIGAIICVLVVLILPEFLKAMYGDPNAEFAC